MKTRIGIVLWAHPHYGGVYQYSLSVLNAAAALDPERYDITVFYRHRAWTRHMHDEHGSRFSWIRYHANIPVTILGMTFKIAERHKFFMSVYKRLHPLYHHASSSAIDLMIYPAPMTLSFEIGAPYIVAVHDLQHRLHPEFTEVSKYGEWDRREYLFSNCIRNASCVIAESVVGKGDILALYGARDDSVHVLPYVPPFYLTQTRAADVVQNFGLPPRYLFYPAQFWKHKNHVRLIEALGLIKRETGDEIPVVLVGSKKNAFRETMKKTEELGLSRQVVYLGYVSEEDMVGLYRTAQALVMPTFFGPSNIPQLEAFLLGCPVITSDVPGIYEQVGDAALLVDPRSAESIAAGISRIWRSEELRQDLIRKGHERIASFTQTHFNAAFRDILARTERHLSRSRSVNQ